MNVFFSEMQQLHDSQEELVCGQVRRAMDSPLRAIEILNALSGYEWVRCVSPRAGLSKPVMDAVHDPVYVDFLQEIYENWKGAYPTGKAFPESGCAPGMRRILPQSIRGKLSYYCFDTCTAISEGTWQSAVSSVEAAMAGAEAISSGESYAFSLCRPPGHHAGRDFYGGYCFLNNAAIAAQTWLALTGVRCAVLDVDYHHPNGTQQIFYEREDVSVASLHASPSFAYPFFSGYADEHGIAKGLGHNLNVPLSREATWSIYKENVTKALDFVEKEKVGGLVVSLGVDTHKSDPVGGLGLDTHNYEELGSLIGSVQLPTLVVLEGGYALPLVGSCVSLFLNGLRNVLSKT